MPSTAANPPTFPTSSDSQEHPRTRLISVRRTVIVALVTLLVVGVAAFLTDTVLAARSEHRLAASVQQSPRLRFTPEVTLGGVPFVTHARRGEFPSLTITARGVPLPRAGSTACRATQCWAELGANATDARTAGDAWSIGGHDELFLGATTGYAKVDSVNLGRMLDITDLSVNTPAPQDKAGGGGPGDGLLERTSGVLLTGTVALPPDSAAHYDVAPSASKYPGPKIRVSVSVDLSVRGDALVITPTGFYDGPEEHASADVPANYRDSVLRRFARVVPMPRLPWGITPTSANSAGSDVLITGTAPSLTVQVDQF